MRRLLSALLLGLASITVHATALSPEDIAKKSDKEIEQNLPDSHPAAYYVYAMKLFKAGKRDAAVTWFYTGQIRFRHQLLAVPSDADAAQLDTLNKQFGQAVTDWAGGNTKAWAQQLEKALAWDNAQPNNVTSKETHAAQWQQAREEVSKLRDYVLKSQAEIRAQRAAKGLENRDGR